MPDKSMKRNIYALIDRDASDICELSLAVAINNFLVAPVTFEEALVIYASILDMCNAGNELINEPLRSRLLVELRGVSPLVVSEKMRKYSVSIRRIFADSIASTLCREYYSILENIRGTVRSNSSDELLSQADASSSSNAVESEDFSLLPYSCRA